MLELAKFLSSVYDTDSTNPHGVALELLHKMTQEQRNSLIFLCDELKMQIREASPPEAYMYVPQTTVNLKRMLDELGVSEDRVKEIIARVKPS